jgi:hypothetical protein
MRSAAPREIIATLNFTGLTEASLTSVKAHAINVALDAFGISKDNGSNRPINRVPVSVCNGRLVATTLHREGFVLNEHACNHVDYYNHGEVVSKYYRELEEHIQKTFTGSRRAVAFHHQVRSFKKDEIRSGNRKPKDPVQFVHSDYSIAGGLRALQRLVEPTVEKPEARISKEDAQYYSGVGRFVIVHAWRNISPQPLTAFPLALCCADTLVDETDLLAYDLCYSDRIDGVMAVKHNAAHRWLCYPDMHRDELLLFKQYDSASTVAVSHSENNSCTSPFLDTHESSTAIRDHDAYSPSIAGSHSGEELRGGDSDSDREGSNSEAVLCTGLGTVKGEGFKGFVSCWVPHSAIGEEFVASRSTPSTSTSTTDGSFACTSSSCSVNNSIDIGIESSSSSTSATPSPTVLNLTAAKTSSHDGDPLHNIPTKIPAAAAVAPSGRESIEVAVIVFY